MESGAAAALLIGSTPRRWPATIELRLLLAIRRMVASRRAVTSTNCSTNAERTFAGPARTWRSTRSAKRAVPHSTQRMFNGYTLVELSNSGLYGWPSIAASSRSISSRVRQACSKMASKCGSSSKSNVWCTDLHSSLPALASPRGARGIGGVSAIVSAPFRASFWGGLGSVSRSDRPGRLNLRVKALGAWQMTTTYSKTYGGKRKI
jgi:hypothetical protein